MERKNNPIRLFNFPKNKSKRMINSSKNNIKLHTLITKKKIIDEVQPNQFSSQVKRKAMNKFNSIDNIVLHNHIDPNNYIYEEKETTSPRKPKKILKNNKNFEDYLEKLYEDEPHLLKKSLFKKSNNTKNFNRKVSFLKPFNSKRKTNVNEKSYLMPGKSNDFTKSRIFNYDDFGDEQSYAYNKKYSVNIFTNTNNNDLMKTCVFNHNNNNNRSIMRKQSYKTIKNTVNLKLRNSEKKSSKTLNHLRKEKKKESSKSNEKRFRKKISKLIKDKTINYTDYNFNNLNNDDIIQIERSKIKKFLATDKFEFENKNGAKKLINNSDKKNPDLSPKKSIENVETLVQIEEQNKKKRKKQFCCPFLICLKMSNNEDNEKIIK